MPKPYATPARHSAFDILKRVESEGAYASMLLSAIPEERLSPEDRGLTRELVLGVLRRQSALDYFIKRYSGRAPSGMDTAVRLALRIGLYQLRYLSRIPPHAAVNESVNLVKTGGARSAAGLVNAVLRKAASKLEDKAGEGIENSVERAAIEVSHPVWILERWSGTLAESPALALALANNEPQPVAFRVNTLRASEAEALDFLKGAGVVVRPSGVAPCAYVVERGGGPALVDAARNGMIYLQDQASQLISLLLQPRVGHRILDLCAAPGSKTSHIAALTGNKAWILAGDLHAHRLATLSAICKTLGVECVDAAVLDATKNLPFGFEGSRFDRVLVDAPCTGTGTLRENPEIKWRLAPGDVARLAAIQDRLLENASGAVAKGGRLVYSTCSIEPEEGEDVIERFLPGHAEFRLVLPEVDSSLVTPDGFVRTYPHTHGTSGFFVAVMERS